ncbi:MAG: hypothetical protein V4864_18730 [Pseudomonadota bacterium]
MRKQLANFWRAALLLAGIALAGIAYAQTVGNACYATSCRGQDAATLGGSCFGHLCGAGYAGNTGGDCLGDSCNAGNGNTVGGNCYGAGCKAGSAWNHGGDCYGQGCTPGNGGTVSGNAYGTAKNTACMLGEIYRFPTNARPANLVNWNTPPGAACQPVYVYNQQGQRVPVEIKPVAVPSPAPAPTAVTALPANPYDPANLPKCPFTCQAYNPASQSCVGAAMNVC